MNRFILRIQGKATISSDDIKRIRALPNTTVLDASSPRMLLVEGPEAELERLVASVPGLIMTPERMIPLPDPRPRPRQDEDSSSDKGKS